MDAKIILHGQEDAEKRPQTRAQKATFALRRGRKIPERPSNYGHTRSYKCAGHIFNYPHTAIPAGVSKGRLGHLGFGQAERQNHLTLEEREEKGFIHPFLPLHRQRPECENGERSHTHSYTHLSSPSTETAQRETDSSPFRRLSQSQEAISLSLSQTPGDKSIPYPLLQSRHS